MRFIAVFNQVQKSSGLGFDTLVDAMDFLFWGYEDKDLLPHGIYDVLTDQTTPYNHAGQFIGNISIESIRATAVEYFTNSIAQLAGIGRPSCG